MNAAGVLINAVKEDFSDGIHKHSMAPLTLDELEIYHCLFGTRTEQNLPVRGLWPWPEGAGGRELLFSGPACALPKEAAVWPAGREGC